ncbi:hypothetical protein K2X92_01755 [Candidatus Gracilibacteria bacterium]|nr:hypothetical protein [Candidatus Gracilibacteria bacterium]
MRLDITKEPIMRLDISEALIREKIPGLRNELSDDQILDLTQVLKNNIRMRDGVLIIQEILPAHIAVVLTSSWQDVFKTREEDKK